MVKIITRKVKEGFLFKRKELTKVGVEGGNLHDSIKSQTEKLVCFFDKTEKLYYLYSLVSGNLVAKSRHFIECIKDNYFIVDFDDFSCIYFIDHNENKKNDNDSTPKTVFEGTTIYSGGTIFLSKNYSYRDEFLFQYTNDKKICITNMITNERSEFYFSNFKDLEDLEVYSTKVETCNKLSLVLKDKDWHYYFNVYDTSKNEFLFYNFVNGNIKETKEYDGKLYIITYNNELIDQNGNILINKFYSSICFHSSLPYVYLTKCLKKGLANLEGNIIFDAIYDEIMETPEKFVVNVRETKEYVIKEVEKLE